MVGRRQGRVGRMHVHAHLQRRVLRVDPEDGQVRVEEEAGLARAADDEVEVVEPLRSRACHTHAVHVPHTCHTRAIHMPYTCHTREGMHMARAWGRHVLEHAMHVPARRGGRCRRRWCSRRASW